MNDLNDRFVMVPTVLLDIPTFVRNFDSKPIGSIYRVLCSKVWRKSSEGLRKNPAKRTKILASLYESGALASIHDLSSLSIAMGYTERSIRRELLRLEELGLMRPLKSEGEVFYIVGEANLKSSGNRFMGHSSESLYLEAWKDFANFINQYAPQVMHNFEDDLDKFFTKDGQKFHKFVTKISLNPTLDGFRKLVRDMENSSDDSPLIEKVIEKVIKPLAAGPMEKVEDSGKDIQILLIDEGHVEPKDALKTARKKLRSEEITKLEFTSYLQSYISSEFKHYSSTPVFAIELAVQKYSENEESYKLTRLWSALREDLDCSIQPKDTALEFGKLLGNFKSILKKYSFNQLYWTLTSIVATSVDTSNFIIKTVGAFEYHVRKQAHEYQTLRDANLRKIKSRDKLASQRAEGELEVEEDLDSGHSHTGRFLDALMGWDDKHE